METYSFYFREYADAGHTKISRIDAQGNTRLVTMTTPNTFIIAGDGAALLDAIMTLAAYGIEKIQYMHPAESEVTEEIIPAS